MVDFKGTKKYLEEVKQNNPELYSYFDIEPPWLHTDNIDTMVSTMRSLINQPILLSKLQSDTFEWYSNIKSKIYKNINEAVTTQ